MIQLILRSTTKEEPQEYGSPQIVYPSRKVTYRRSKGFGINGLALIFLVVMCCFVAITSVVLQYLIYDYNLSVWRANRRKIVGYERPDRIIFEPSVLVYEESVTVPLYEEDDFNYVNRLSYETYSSIKKPITTDPNDVHLLALLAQAEAGNQGPEGMRRVVDVVLNRVESPKFPNTVSEVIFQPGQFMTADELLTNVKQSAVASKTVTTVYSELYSDRIDNQSLYFARSPITHKGLYQFGDHYFSY